MTWCGTSPLSGYTLKQTNLDWAGNQVATKMVAARFGDWDTLAPGALRLGAGVRGQLPREDARLHVHWLETGA